MESQSKQNEIHPAMDSQKNSWEIPVRQVWVMLCPRCTVRIEKEHPANSWKCPCCGWE